MKYNPYRHDDFYGRDLRPLQEYELGQVQKGFSWKLKQNIQVKDSSWVDKFSSK